MAMYEWLSHNTQRAHEIYVSEGPRKEAMKRLHERMEAGEDVYEILDIPRSEKYYVDKIVAGLVPISYGLYGRIMKLDEEDDFSE